MTPEHKALVAARAEVDAEHAKVNGDDGYNYAAGQEYGLRLALIVLDKHLAAIESLSTQSGQPQTGEPVAWMHPQAGWANTSRAAVAARCRKDGPQPVPLYASPQPASPAQGVSELVAGLIERCEPTIANRNRDPGYKGYHDQTTQWMRDAVHALRALTAAIGAGGKAVAVKPMEWVDADEGMCTKWRAAALGGHYELVDFGKDDPGFAVNFHWGRPLSFWFIQGEPDERGPTGPKIFPTLKAAKAAAQADYERRILSALSQPHPADERVVEALRVKIEKLVCRGLYDNGKAVVPLEDVLAALAQEGRNV